MGLLQSAARSGPLSLSSTRNDGLPHRRVLTPTHGQPTKRRLADENVLDDPHTCKASP